MEDTKESNDKTNSVCLYCDKRFNATIEDLVVCETCGYICHQSCYVCYMHHIKHITNEGNSKCCLCTNANINVIHENDISTYSEQKHVDIQTLKMTNYKPSIKDYLRGFVFRVPYLLFHFSLLYMDFLYGNIFGKYSHYRYKTFLNAIAYGLNVNSTIDGQEKIKEKSKVVYVVNHVSFYDALTIPRYINSGPIASISVMRHVLVTILSKYTNILFVKRGDQNKTKSIVDQLNEFVDEHSNVIVCPQGLLGKYNTLSKFRTTAFRTKYPIQPVVLKYKQDVSSIQPLHMLLYPRVDIEIHVMDPVSKPDDKTPDQFADEIRNDMAIKCGFKLSNVHSKDIKD